MIKSRGPEELITELQRIEKTIRLENSSQIMDEQRQSYTYMLESKNASYQKVLDVIEKAADSKASILILGESGVGKEVLAQYAHKMSKSGQNFLAVNCHALSANVVESELFGHEKGAFTGATSRHKGRFEAVDGGTLFLDEIGDIPPAIQAKLLRTLESRTIERIGNNKSIDVDFRLISATNAKIHQAIADGAFREDLFYRLSAITVEAPPLRSRMEDLPSLINFFLEKFSRDMKKTVEPPPEKVLSLLMNHHYPGNVRELKNIVERLVVLARNGRISEEDLPDNFGLPSGNPSPAPSAKEGMTLRMARVNAERDQILYALAKANNNVSQAATLLDVSVRQLFYKIKEYNITAKP